MSGTPLPAFDAAALGLTLLLRRILSLRSVGEVKEPLVIILPYQTIWHKKLGVAYTVRRQFEYFRVFGNVRREDGLTWLLNILLWP